MILNLELQPHRDNNHGMTTEKKISNTKVNVKKVAVVLSGCGNKDGSEITEAVSLIIALAQHQAHVQFFAPNIDVTAKNFLTNEALPHKRNILLESARITRSQIQDLNLLNADLFDALVFPGGFGAALHLCNWGEAKSKAKLLPAIQKNILDFYNQSKPIGAICIAPVLLACALGDKNITLTVGDDAGTIAEIEKTGAQHEICPVTDYITDREHKVITTPAYMYDANAHQVFTGISGLAKELIEMA